MDAANTLLARIEDLIEKVLRYAAPGMVLVIGIKLGFPTKYSQHIAPLSQYDLWMFAVLSGLIIYSLHRVALCLVENLLFHRCFGIMAFSTESGCGFSDGFGNFIKRRHSDSRPPYSSYLFYRWSIAHFSLIFCELLLLFLITHEPKSVFENRFWHFTIFGVVVLICSIHHLWIMYRVEQNLFSASQS